MRMYAKDHPDEFKIVNPEIARGEHFNQVFQEWDKRLCGKARLEFYRNPQAYLKKYYNVTMDTPNQWQ